MNTRKINNATAVQQRGTVAGKLAAAAITAVFGSLYGVQQALGQGASSLTVEVSECVELQYASDRLACFEAQVNAVLEDRGPGESGGQTGATENQEPDAAASNPVPQPPTGDERRATSRAEQQGTKESRKLERAVDEYFGTVTAFRARQPNRFLITLDNGQVWEQTAAKRYPLRRGLQVRIYPTTWGPSYRLTGLDTGGFIQVQRVQ
jgi:hypothetical protein